MCLPRTHYDKCVHCTVWPEHRVELQSGSYDITPASILVQTCASVPLRTLDNLLLKKYDEKHFGLLALDFKEM